MKFYSLKFMLNKYGRFSDKFGMLCIAREEDLTGKRVYFIVSLNKFLYHYPVMSNRHYYEVLLSLRLNPWKNKQYNHQFYFVVDNHGQIRNIL